MILNHGTSVVHRRKPEAEGLAAECGALRRVDAGRIGTVGSERADEADDLDWCGRCFDRGGGY